MSVKFDKLLPHPELLRDEFIGRIHRVVNTLESKRECLDAYGCAIIKLLDLCNEMGELLEWIGDGLSRPTGKGSLLVRTENPLFSELYRDCEDGPR